MRSIVFFTTAFVLVFVACSLTLAEDGQRRITVLKDRAHTSVGGSVNHGERITYLIEARTGQEMEVRVVSIGNKAAIAIYEPQAEHAIREVEEGRDVKRWKGRLLKSGDYRVTVGSTDGNAHYRLTISLK